MITAGTCGSCDSTCKTCSITASNCTACYTNTSLPYLTITLAKIGSCTGSCTDGFYGDLLNGICASCASITPSINCIHCSSQTTCLSCDSGFILYLSKCIASAPPGYYNDSNVAVKCDPNCATCSLLPTNCTSCIGTLALNNYTCMSSCDEGEVAVDNVCVTCDSSSPYYCRTCQGTRTYCTDCVVTSPLVYLFSGSCVSSSDCPNYTYPDSSSRTCKNCLVDSHC